MFETAHGRLVPELRGGLSCDFGIDDRVITAAFADAPNASFAMDGQEVAHWGFVAGSGLAWVAASGISTELKYAGEFRENYQSHSLMGLIRFAF